ncbi:MAG: glycosyltransferase family 4 protein, partial [Actinomycetota bacterium]|nr:glycosyltransferase family 4 protein [Actinomycetota bacterium]
DHPMAADVRTLFDPVHYAAQRGAAFGSFEEALDDYLRAENQHRYDPHPLFDTQWYLTRNPAVRALELNPLLHFVEHCAEEAREPNPYFDTEFYYSQSEALRTNRVNALAHYVTHGGEGGAWRPNPLFGDGFYCSIRPEVRASGANPLAHYLTSGWRQGGPLSSLHHDMLNDLARSSSSSCLRGNWKVGTVVFALGGDGAEDEWLLSRLVGPLAEDHHVESLVVSLRQPPRASQDEHVRRLVVEDYVIAGDVLRPAALRLLMRSLASSRPLFAVATRAELLEALHLGGVPCYLAVSEEHMAWAPRLLDHMLRQARRALLPSTDHFQRMAARLGRHPARVGLLGRPTPAREATSGPARKPRGAEAEALMELARSDFDLHGIDERPGGRSSEPTRKVIVPCSDWAVSGVNASLEALARELIGLGWDVEIVFTRSEEYVVQSAQGEGHMPTIPYRFLDRRTPGLQGMWEALIADVEQSAPCIVLTAYDFLANSCIPALTEQVGVVAWVQADDGDYYEQAYRLGRYCNAVVCVSQCLKDKVTALNPLIGERAEVIPNSSVRADEVVARRKRSGETLRLVYSGRLVQYQKRVLDYIELATALDATGVPYEMTLIGAFAAREDVRDDFVARAQRHIDDGRIRLPGRKSRTDVFRSLSEHDFFVLLSDFEGFPLALV